MSATSVLVADDHASLRKLVRTLLSRATDWTIVEAVDGDEALELWKANSFDLAILDQRMPGRTGTEVARTLRDDGFSGPIVLFSAYLDPGVEDEASRLELLTVEKSDLDRLVAVVTGAVGGK